MRPHALATLLVVATVAPAEARGLAAKDLTTVERAVLDKLGPGFDARAEPNRIDLICTGCAGAPMIGIQLGRQDDGTEGRVRSGQTRIADLERLCQARSSECRLSALDVAPAVGWVSGYAFGGTAGATAVIIRDGDLLTIRSLATDAATARRGIDKLLPLIRSRLIGR